MQRDRRESNEEATALKEYWARKRSMSSTEGNPCSSYDEESCHGGGGCGDGDDADEEDAKLAEAVMNSLKLSYSPPPQREVKKETNRSIQFSHPSTSGS